MKKGTRQLLTALALVAGTTGVFGQAIYKCGATVQDKPCDTDVQKRFSQTSGGFNIEQTNPRGNPNCVKIAQLGQQIAQAHADGKRGSDLYDMVEGAPSKNARRSFVEQVLGIGGSPRDARMHLEANCAHARNTLAYPPAPIDDRDFAPTIRTSNPKSAKDSARAAADAARAAAASVKN